MSVGAELPSQLARIRTIHEASGAGQVRTWGDGSVVVPPVVLFCDRARFSVIKSAARSAVVTSGTGVRTPTPREPPGPGKYPAPAAPSAGPRRAQRATRRRCG